MRLFPTENAPTRRPMKPLEFIAAISMLALTVPVVDTAKGQAAVTVASPLTAKAHAYGLIANCQSSETYFSAPTDCAARALRRMTTQASR